MHNDTPRATPRKLTRSSTDRKIAGVSGGLGEYFGVDPLLIRIGFVATTLTGGAGLFAYLGILVFVRADDHEPVEMPARTAEPVAA
jgi:phage shock protein C